MKQLILALLIIVIFTSCRKDKTEPKPNIVSINPTAGTANISVTINGTSFGNSISTNSVKFNGVIATVTSSTTTRLVAIVPSGGSTGVVTVTCSTGSAIGPIFTYLYPPTISSISPTSGDANTVVTITGTNFKLVPADNIVKFNGVVAVVQAATISTLTVIVPVGALTGTITVSTMDGTATSSVFTVSPLPTITAISSSSGWYNNILTITGTNFSAIATNNSVSINGVQAIVQSATLTTITVLVPPMSGIKTGTVDVITHSGKATGPTFTYCTLYIGGEELNNSHSMQPKYWTNDIPTLLSNGNYDGFVNAIFVVNNDLYFAGDEDGNDFFKAKYWANGIAHYLTNGPAGATSKGIAVDGNDIYIVGNDYSGIDSPAKCWKNGVASFMVSSGNASFEAITIVNKDIYITGAQNGAAKYWKNGVVFDLTTDSQNSMAQSITVIKGNIYVAGGDMKTGGNLIAQYWKNGIATPLGDPNSKYSMALSIAVVNDDVYVAGYESTIPGGEIAMYWKNGVATALTDGTRHASANAIAVVGSDVYVAGYESNGTNDVAKYWKNGIAISLTDGFNPGKAKAIFIQ